MSDTSKRSGALSELRRLVPYIKRYKTRTYLGLVFITLSNICSTTVPHVVGTTIDTLKLPGNHSGDVPWLITQILLLTIGSGFFMFCTRRTIIVMSRRVEEDLRNDFTNALRTQPAKFFHDRSTGSLLAHFSNDIGSVREFIGPAIMYTANTITTFAFALSWMVNLNGWLSAAILIPVPLVATLTYRLGRKIHANYRTVQEHYEHITTHAQESASGIRVIRAYARGEEEAQRFDELSRDYYRKNMRLARVQSLMMPGMTVLFNLSYVIVIGFGGWLVSTNKLTVGELTQFFIYLNQLLWPIAAIGWVTGMIQRGAASIGRLGAIIDAPSTVVSGSNAMPDVDGDVEFRNVTLAYDGQTPVLSNVSFRIEKGQSLGIVGSVGSGKSSIIGLLPRMYDASAGAVLIDGIDVRDVTLSDLRANIAVVPQESFLFSETIRENIRFGRPTASDDEVRRAAEIAQLPTDISTLPDGFDTVVGERGVTLSGGQKQRTSLARAIVSDPKILILDDALSAVDASTEDRILSGLDDVMRGRTTIIISHRISTVQRCTNILVLDHGRVVEHGSHAELLQRKGQYFDMYERQQLEQQLS
ncbi:MAG: ABC transporter ATP-binding protein [Candidatus Kapabacteria bacterium]|nr:ABC transporter ATP-binding protein [Candidatus Kapabacteria bacterium]